MSKLSDDLMGVLQGINEAHRTGYTVSPHKIVELRQKALNLEAEIINLKNEAKNETRS
jgi:hypothetical protein